MSNSVWIVGQSLDRDKEGAVLWRKIGTFLDEGMAKSWKAYTGADIMLEQMHPGMTILPTFSQIGVSVFPSSVEPCREGGTCH